MEQKIKVILSPALQRKIIIPGAPLMKKRILLFALLMIVNASAPQSYAQEFTLDNLPARRLEIAYHKTISLSFPYPIQSVDRGSKSVLVKKLEGADNILLLKAAERDFAPTNLTVITKGGRLFGFLLHFNPDPGALNLRVLAGNSGSPSAGMEVQLSSPGDRLAGLRRLAREVLERKPVTLVSGKNKALSASVSGIFVAGNHICWRLRVENLQAYPLSLDPARLYTRARHGWKRKARQQVQLTPLLIYPERQRLDPGECLELVLITEPVAMPGGRRLMISLTTGLWPPLELRIRPGKLRAAGILNGIP